jgi:hypothetical protein
MLLLYWTQNLAGFEWTWMNFIKPVLDLLISIGSSISNDSIKLFAATFEYKYFVALIILAGIYLLINGIEKLLETLKDIFDNGYRATKKIQEKILNKNLKTKNTLEQKALKKYNIYVSTGVKKKFSHLENAINIDEQNIQMNKFLIEKTGVSPVSYENGFLYSFEDFDSIDKNLEVFFKLLNSDSPLNYYVSVQVLTKKCSEDEELFKKLISLKFENKITMTSEAAYRYRFNDFHMYGTSQLGLFQKEDETFEVHEFIKI